MRAVIGVTGQFSAVDNLLTGEENLLLMADLHHLRRAEGRRRTAELLERFDLVEAAGKPASTYSGGMRRRLDLAMTLVGDPRIIFLDEPTTGLDPRSRRTMWQIIRDLVADGVTIFLTTQYLDEADQLADRIAVLDQGAGRRGHARPSSSGGSPAATSACSSPTRRDWSGRRRPRRSARDDEALTLQVPGDGGRRARCDRCSTGSTGVDRGGQLSLHTPDLDDVFFALTGQPAERKHDDHPLLRRDRLDHHAAARAAPQHATVGLTLMLVACRSCSCCCSSTSSVARWARASAASRGRTEYVDYVVPGILMIAVGSVAPEPRSRSPPT